MDLYKSDGTHLQNTLNPLDATISIPIINGYIYDIFTLCNYIKTEMDRYVSYFATAPEFSITYDYSEEKFTIKSLSNVVFGIGFRFNRANGDNNYGSLHQQLGFDKKLYLGNSSYTSVRTPAIFNNAYTSEYLFVCSDLISYNYDASLIVPESQGNSTFYECLFAIPISEIKNYSYIPIFENEHRVRIHASSLAKKYNESLSDPKTVIFYLKTSSGRHIKISSQWSIKIEVEYIN